MVNYQKIVWLLQEFDIVGLYKHLYNEWKADNVDAGYEDEGDDAFLTEWSPFETLKEMYGLAVPAYMHKVSGYPLDMLTGGYEKLIDTNSKAKEVPYFTGNDLGELYEIVLDEGPKNAVESVIDLCPEAYGLMSVATMTDKQIDEVAHELFLNIYENVYTRSDAEKKRVTNDIVGDLASYRKMVKDRGYDCNDIRCTVYAYLCSATCAAFENIEDASDGYTMASARMDFYELGADFKRMVNLYYKNHEKLPEYASVMDLFNKVVGYVGARRIKHGNTVYIVTLTYDAYSCIDHSVSEWVYEYIHIPLFRLFLADAKNICASMEQTLAEKNRKEESRISPALLNG